MAGALDGLPDDADLSSTWSFEPSGDGLWLAVELTNPTAATPFKRSQLITPTGLGHRPREDTNPS